MKYNPYYLDLNDQQNLSDEQIRMVKENNYSFVRTLNAFLRAVNDGPEAIKRFRKTTASHNLVKHPDSETGVNTYNFTEKIRFLAEELEKNPKLIKRFTNETGCGRALTYLFAGYNYYTTEKDFCDSYCRWKEYKLKGDAPARFKDQDPLGVALYLQKNDRQMPIGLDYCKLVDSIVKGYGDDMHLELVDNNGKIISAVEQQLFDLKTNESFFNYYTNDYYSKDDEEVAQKAIRERKAAYEALRADEEENENA